MAETQVNGTPPPAADDTPASVPVSERLMGLFGIAVAIGILIIGFDLASGGKAGAWLSARTSEPGE